MTNHQVDVGDNLRIYARYIIARFIWPNVTIFLVYQFKILLLRYNINTGPFFLFTLVIFLNTWIGGFIGGMFTTLVAAFAATYFASPQGNLALPEGDDAILMLVFLIQSLVITATVQYVININKRLRETNKLLKINKKELERVRSTYQKLLNASIMGTLIIDARGKVLKVNDSFLFTVGYKRSELYAKDFNIEQLTPTEFRDQDMDAAEELLTTGYAGPLEKELIRQDGQRVPVLISMILIDEDKQHILYLVQDISERKKIEDRKDEFIGIASHELKTPLTSIQGYLQLAEKFMLKGDHKMVNNLIAKLDVQVIRLTELINELLDVSRMQSGKLELNLTEVDFSQLIAGILDEMQPQTNSHKLEVHMPKKLSVEADRFRLGQVIRNLLANAIKYSEPGSKIIITLMDLGGEARFEIQDFGIGIAKSRLSKLFERYYRVEEAVEGVHLGFGLGLYISAEILKSHGSQIFVESEKGKGSRFYFSLKSYD